MEQQIREALGRIESADWKASYEEGTNFPFMHIYGKDCVTLAENAPRYLEWCLSQISTLQQQNKQLVETVLDAEVYLKLDEDIPDDKELAYELGYKDALWNLSDAIRSLQGGSSNENAQP